MKKKVLAIALVTAFTGMGVAQAADVTAQAVATWSATAKKDTTSKLVVTPLGSLAFQYAEGIKGFNSQKGLFDVAIEGDTTATAFKLTSRLITNTLTQLDTSGSTLSVGVDYNGAAVEKTGDTVMIDTANNIMAATSARWLMATTPAAVPPRRMVSLSPSSAAPPTAPPP
ncbi:fimbrillin MatB [Klebsiella pneumoniae]|nr:fimbrillin MatB [Klebsiella pneumoniae]